MSPREHCDSRLVLYHLGYRYLGRGGCLAVCLVGGVRFGAGRTVGEWTDFVMEVECIDYDDEGRKRDFIMELYR